MTDTLKCENILPGQGVFTYGSRNFSSMAINFYITSLGIIYNRCANSKPIPTHSWWQLELFSLKRDGPKSCNKVLLFPWSSGLVVFALSVITPFRHEMKWIPSQGPGFTSNSPLHDLLWMVFFSALIGVPSQSAWALGLDFVRVCAFLG